ncbi:MAG: hypothetical protein AB7G11_15810 [Phycisphaerales bacterium]
MTRADGAWFVLNVENDRLIAAHVRASGGSSPRLRVLGGLSRTAPSTLDVTKTADLGAWIAKELKEAGLDGAARRSRVMFAVPRSEVMLKRVAFPPGTVTADQAEIVRLQMVRQLTLSPESAVIDFAGADPGLTGRSRAVSDASAAGESVLAGALQAERVEWRRAVAQAAGFRVSSISLKASGAASIVADAGATGGAMGITVGCGAIEFVLVEHGQLVFARGSDLVRPSGTPGNLAEEEAFADKVAVEAKRTWMSYRSAPDSIEVESVHVLGTDRCASAIAQRCRESLECRAETIAVPSYVEVDAGVNPELVPDLAPLIGLVGERMLGRATLDFANPRRAPDAGAAMRQRALLGALAAILVLGGAYTYARLDLKQRESRLTQLTQEWGAQTTKYADFVRMKAKVAHVAQWRQTRFDWLAHVGFLNEQLPDTKDATLESISGRGDQDVIYARSPGDNAYSKDAWSSSLRGTFTISGKVKRREIADALRLRIVDDKRYILDSKGADTADRFDWRLITSRSKPDDTGAAAPASTKPAPGKVEAPRSDDQPRSGGTP